MKLSEKTYALWMLYKEEAGDGQAAVRDLLTDLRHLGDDYGLDLPAAWQASGEVYAEEQEGIS